MGARRRTPSMLARRTLGRAAVHKASASFDGAPGGVCLRGKQPGLSSGAGVCAGTAQRMASSGEQSVSDSSAPLRKETGGVQVAATAGVSLVACCFLPWCVRATL